MLNITVSIEKQSPTAEFYTIARNKHYRVKTGDGSSDCISIPESLFMTFQHQFEHVGAIATQRKRKQALGAIVQSAYLCAQGILPLHASEELYISHNNVTMTFNVTPEVKSLFFSWFKNVRKDKYAKSRWYILNALVYYAWLATK